LAPLADIAFFMLMAHRTRDVGIVVEVARIILIADFPFTATAVIATDHRRRIATAPS
jgi:uncharacterized membrane protein